MQQKNQDNPESGFKEAVKQQTEIENGKPKEQNQGGGREKSKYATTPLPQMKISVTIQE